MQWILPLIYTFIFIFVINKWNFFVIKEVSSTALAIIFIFKIIAGTIAWFVFSHYYSGGDMLSYFQDGNTLFSILMHDPGKFYRIVFAAQPCSELLIWNSSFDTGGYNTARTMSLLNLVFRFFSFGNFHVHTVMLNFLSLIGLVGIYKTFSGYIIKNKNIFFCAVFLMPSVLFWGSAVLKEGLLMFVSGTLVYLTAAGLKTRYTWKDGLFIFVFIALHLLIKPYVLAALLPGFIVNAWVSRSSSNFLLLKYLVVFVGFFVISAGLSAYNPDLNISRMIADKQTKAILEARGGVYLYNDQRVVCIDYEKKDEQLEWMKDSSCRIKTGSNYVFWNQHHMSQPDSVINSTDTSLYFPAYIIKGANSVTEIPKVKPAMISLVTSIPAAIFHSLTAPALWNLKNKIYILPAFENLLYLLLLVFTLIFISRSTQAKPAAFFCLGVGLILLFFAGVSTPVIGTLICYKAPALLFLAIAFVLVSENARTSQPDNTQ